MDLPAGLGDRLVEALHAVHGEYPGHRAAHAKGSCCDAVFTPSEAGRALTRAAHFAGPEVPAVVRFSNGSGIPAYPDYARSDGRGMAVKFKLPDGTHADMVALTLPVFFVRDPEAFMEFLTVTRPDPATRQPDLALVGAFLERHPETQSALGAAMAGELPASYLRARYNGIHAFRLTNSAGDSAWVRYRWEPAEGEAGIEPAAARAGGREYLQEQLRARLAQGPSGFRLVFILAGDGDSLTDPTEAWPEDRGEVVAGHLSVTSVSDLGACEPLVFDPTNVVDGIDLPDDPILHARSVAYARSFAARRGMTLPSGTPAAPPTDAGAAALRQAQDLEPGTMRVAEVDGNRVGVANVAGTMRAFQDRCPHRGCSLGEGALAGNTVTCACHGSQFDLVTGAVLRGPAKDPINVYGGADAGGTNAT